MTAARTLATVITDAIEARLQEVNTAVPAEVLAYNLALQQVDVRPLVKRAWVDAEGNEVSEALPDVYAVPVAFPRAGAAFVSLPIQKGDLVLLVVCQRSLDTWKSLGGQQDPGDLRLHNLAGAVAIPGVYPQVAPLATADPAHIVVGWDTGEKVYIKSSGVDLGMLAGAEKMALGTTLKAHLDAIATWMAGLKSAFSGSVIVPSDGGASLKATTLAAWPADPVVPAVESVKHTLSG